MTSMQSSDAAFPATPVPTTQRPPVSAALVCCAPPPPRLREPWRTLTVPELLKATEETVVEPEPAWTKVPELAKVLVPV